jgi:hypothetical protein
VIKLRIKTVKVKGKTKVKNYHGAEAKIVLMGTQKAKIIFKESGFEKVVYKSHLYSKNLKDYKQPTMLSGDLGFIGDGEYNLKDHYNLYLRWYRLLQRAKSGKITVFEPWYNFQNFAAWYEQRLEMAKERKHIIKRRLKSYTNHFCPTNCYIT